MFIRLGFTLPCIKRLRIQLHTVFFSSLVCTVQFWSALDCRVVVSKERERMIREKTRPPLPAKALQCNVMQDSQLIERDRVHCTAM